MFNVKNAGLTALSTVMLAMSAQGAYAIDYIVPYVGWFDATQQDDEAIQFGAEYRFSPWEYGIRPTIGANFTTDGSVYGYAGINWDIELIPNQVYVIPNFMAGGYSQGSGKDLGSGVEFRSGIEVDYQMPNAHRIGVAFNHISNASIGDRNPGAETFLLNYSLPTGAVLR